ncbi:MAG: hypothetical protein U1E29_06455, partial [Coriobacteriia bacterium]|nr:hypothetical protein [Coriobacteriia bacterium]
MHHAGRFKPRARMTFATLLVVAALSAAVYPATATAASLETLSAVLMYDNPGPGQSVLLISGRLPEGTPLPAEIVLPVPADSTVLWSGEYRGDTGQENLPAEATIEERDGINVIAFTLTESLTGLAEIA